MNPAGQARKGTHREDLWRPQRYSFGMDAFFWWNFRVIATSVVIVAVIVVLVIWVRQARRRQSTRNQT